MNHETSQESKLIEIEENKLAKKDNLEALPDKISNAIALILVITFSSVCGLSLILLTLAVSLNKVTFSEAKDVFCLILVALIAMTSTSMGFYLGRK
ncbi:hypothetical protein [Pseudanabaena sp. ABRG5-3]|uniref:hypothetical protein n=1 Tax=Pseudanabaena sp. ABRG5-3 TaxID=685565 RepID=UPI000DC6E86E|nr:hypothetical protein [Pseudanabaena sp. ABRG5-3]BBC23301.1 hypothetical protein ABRG53_1044 [Pseudanabaena sp. ABRG5-3]